MPHCPYTVKALGEMRRGCEPRRYHGGVRQSMSTKTKSHRKGGGNGGVRCPRVRVYPCALPPPRKRADALRHFIAPARLRRRVQLGSSSAIKQKVPRMGEIFSLEQMTGIEPACLAWEASALPLSYICVRYDFTIKIHVCQERKR